MDRETRTREKRLAMVIEDLGWDFVPTGPEEWSWMLFDPESGRCIGQQGDITWNHDIKIAKSRCGISEEK